MAVLQAQVEAVEEYRQAEAYIQALGEVYKLVEEAVCKLALGEVEAHCHQGSSRNLNLPPSPFEE